MNVGDALVNLATAPLRIGLAATQVSLEVANEVIEVAKRATGEVPGVIGGSTAMVHMLGLDETVARAQRIAIRKAAGNQQHLVIAHVALARAQPVNVYNVRRTARQFAGARGFFIAINARGVED